MLFSGERDPPRSRSRPPEVRHSGVSHQYIATVINLLPPDARPAGAVTLEDAQQRLRDADPLAVLDLEGSFALVAQQDEKVYPGAQPRPAAAVLPRQGRGRPRPHRRRAHRPDRGRALQPRDGATSSTPATRGWCPPTTSPPSASSAAPTPTRSTGASSSRTRGTLPPDLDLHRPPNTSRPSTTSRRRWLARQDATAPIGVAFSGGIDSGAVLLCLNRALLDAGQSPARLKAFTLSIDGAGDDANQALRVPGPHGPADAGRGHRRAVQRPSTRCAPWR